MEATASSSQVEDSEPSRDEAPIRISSSGRIIRAKFSISPPPIRRATKALRKTPHVVDSDSDASPKPENRIRTEPTSTRKKPKSKPIHGSPDSGLGNSATGVEDVVKVVKEVPGTADSSFRSTSSLSEKRSRRSSHSPGAEGSRSRFNSPEYHNPEDNWKVLDHTIEVLHRNQPRPDRKGMLEADKKKAKKGHFAKYGERTIETPVHQEDLTAANIKSKFLELKLKMDKCGEERSQYYRKFKADANTVERQSLRALGPAFYDEWVDRFLHAPDTLEAMCSGVKRNFSEMKGKHHRKLVLGPTSDLRRILRLPTYIQGPVEEKHSEELREKIMAQSTLKTKISTLIGFRTLPGPIPGIIYDWKQEKERQRLEKEQKEKEKEQETQKEFGKAKKLLPRRDAGVPLLHGKKLGGGGVRTNRDSYKSKSKSVWDYDDVDDDDESQFSDYTDDQRYRKEPNLIREPVIRLRNLTKRRPVYLEESAPEPVASTSAFQQVQMDEMMECDDGDKQPSPISDPECKEEIEETPIEDEADFLKKLKMFSPCKSEPDQWTEFDMFQDEDIRIQDTTDEFEEGVSEDALLIRKALALFTDTSTVEETTEEDSEVTMEEEVEGSNQATLSSEGDEQELQAASEDVDSTNQAIPSLEEVHQEVQNTPEDVDKSNQAMMPSEEDQEMQDKPEEVGRNNQAVISSEEVHQEVQHTTEDVDRGNQTVTSSEENRQELQDAPEEEDRSNQAITSSVENHQEIQNTPDDVDRSNQATTTSEVDHQKVQDTPEDVDRSKQPMVSSSDGDNQGALNTPSATERRKTTAELLEEKRRKKRAADDVMRDRATKLMKLGKEEGWLKQEDAELEDEKEQDAIKSGQKKPEKTKDDDVVFVEEVRKKDNAWSRAKEYKKEEVDEVLGSGRDDTNKSQDANISTESSNPPVLIENDDDEGPPTLLREAPTAPGRVILFKKLEGVQRRLIVNRQKSNLAKILQEEKKQNGLSGLYQNRVDDLLKTSTEEHQKKLAENYYKRKELKIRQAAALSEAAANNLTAAMKRGTNPPATVPKPPRAPPLPLKLTIPKSPPETSSPPIRMKRPMGTMKPSAYIPEKLIVVEDIYATKEQKGQQEHEAESRKGGATLAQLRSLSTSSISSSSPSSSKQLQPIITKTIIRKVNRPYAIQELPPLQADRPISDLILKLSSQGPKTPTLGGFQKLTPSVVGTTVTRGPRKYKAFEGIFEDMRNTNDNVPIINDAFPSSNPKLFKKITNVLEPARRATPVIVARIPASTPASGPLVENDARIRKIISIVKRGSLDGNTPPAPPTVTLPRPIPPHRLLSTTPRMVMPLPRATSTPMVAMKRMANGALVQPNGAARAQSLLLAPTTVTINAAQNQQNGTVVAVKTNTVPGYGSRVTVAESSPRPVVYQNLLKKVILSPAQHQRSPGKQEQARIIRALPGTSPTHVRLGGNVDNGAVFGSSREKMISVRHSNNVGTIPIQESRAMGSGSSNPGFIMSKTARLIRRQP